MHNSRRVLLFDRSLPPEAISASDDTIFISIDSFYHGDLLAAGKKNVKYILEYSKLRFKTYDDLYAYYKPRIDSELRPQNSELNLFEIYYSDISALFAPIYFCKDLLVEIMRAESPCHIETHTVSKHINLILQRLE